MSTKEELRIRVAELCGWKLVKMGRSRTDVYFRGLAIGHKAGVDTMARDLCIREWIPDYPNDLNACAEMEKELTDEQFEQYYEALGYITADHADKPFLPGFSTSARNRAFASATAEQRARAFVAVMSQHGEGR